MRALYPATSFQEAIRTLVAGNPETIRYLKENIAEFQEIRYHQPALDAVLAWKERVRIPDHEWPYTMDLFYLQDGLSVYYLNKRKHEINDEMQAESTGGTGYQFPLLKYMRWVLSKFPPPVRKLIVKIAFDGATVTAGKRRKQEIGTFDFLFDGLDLSAAKSVENTHQFIIYLGGEEREDLERELEQTIQAVNLLVEKGKLTVDETEYEIEPVLVCDMMCLVKVLGLYNCFSPQSKWKCCWCKVHESQLSDFTILSWPFRDEESMRELGRQAEAKKSEYSRSQFARDHYGIRGVPLFNIKFDHIVPCMLHCFMAIMRKLLELLIEEAAHRPKLQQAFEDVFLMLNMKLPKPEKKGKTRTLIERVKGARFGRPDFLRILEHRQDFLNCLASAAKTEALKEKWTMTSTLWEQFAMLTSLATEPAVKLTEEQWMNLTIPFAKRYILVQIKEIVNSCCRFVVRYGGEEVTPYLHVFVYHVGFFMERYGCLERFANYATETQHSLDKRMRLQASSGFGHSDTKAGDICYQQLLFFFRQEYYRVQEKEAPIEGPQRKKRKRQPKRQRKSKENWATRNFNLRAHPETVQFLEGNQQSTYEIEEVIEEGVVHRAVIN